ncbi:hypothetical protein F511_44139 [Dorcoceras hygrometricum]|uniref:Uncharacterized protein n=1 Tax=Dorcoceras hygrometricum TaxID=472368 RepID=A0A2Z6ZY84_9LAMI|nr:hypothetical protein F511_44139 [Dorcoceras hygrometricum]
MPGRWFVPTELPPAQESCPSASISTSSASIKRMLVWNPYPSYVRHSGACPKSVMRQFGMANRNVSRFPYLLVCGLLLELKPDLNARTSLHRSARKTGSAYGDLDSVLRGPAHT